MMIDLSLTTMPSRIRARCETLSPCILVSSFPLNLDLSLCLTAFVAHLRDLERTVAALAHKTSPSRCSVAE